MPSLRETVIRDFEEKGLISKNQITQAYLTMYTQADSSRSYPICGLTLQGIGQDYETDIVTVKVEADGVIIKSVDVTIMAGATRVLEITVPKDFVDRLTSPSCDFIVTVQDTFFRTLAVTQGSVTFDKVIEPVRNEVDAVFTEKIDCTGDDPRVTLASISLFTNTAGPFSLDVFDYGALVWHDTVNVRADEKLEIPAQALKTSFADMTESKLRIVLSRDGTTILDRVETVPVIFPAPTKEKEIKDELPLADGELRTVEFVDVQEAENGSIDLGDAIVTNSGASPVYLSVHLTLDSKEILTIRDSFPAGKKKIALYVPVSRVASEEMRNAEFVLFICDKHDRKVSYRTSTIPIKSKYDMNLRKLDERIPQYVNPRDPAISSMIQDVTGPLARAMGGKYSICGYQDSGSDVHRQMAGAYDAIRSMKVNYVNDPFTIDTVESGMCYQRVKTPQKTIETASGNCIEYSILFASIFEAMGLEPVVMLIPGHAMVGVVLSTDSYKSEAQISDEHLSEFAHTITVSVGGKKTVIVPVESTLCVHENTSLDYASEYALKELEEACQNKGKIDYIFIRKSRLEKKIFPIPGL